MVEWDNRERAKQIIDFDSLRRGATQPMDIDGFYEYHDKGFMIFEMKYGDKFVPEGQRIALERAAKAFNTAGKPAVACICRHYVRDPVIDIDAGNCTVSEIYWGHEGKWRKPNSVITLAEALDCFISYCEG